MHIVTPLLGKAMKELKPDYYSCGIFLRRALMRYLGIALYRLLDTPQRGRTGETASISSLLEMAKSDRVLDNDQIRRFTSDFDKIKAEAAQGEYDIVKKLRELRNIQLAHSLIPWQDPEGDVWGHHLVDLAEAIFNLVMKVDTAIAEATGITLANSRKSAHEFETSASRFWQALAQ